MAGRKQLISSILLLLFVGVWSPTRAQEPEKQPDAEKPQQQTNTEEQQEQTDSEKPNKKADSEKQNDKKKDKRTFKENAAALPAVIWRDRGDAQSLNLIYGAGGEEHAPKADATFTFEKEDMTGSSPKFEVRDSSGVRWKVKMGEEPPAETAATRLLWAAGYFVDEDYYLPEMKVEGLTTLSRGQSMIKPGGVVQRVRLKRSDKENKKIGNWDWNKNPFVGTRELNGLRVMMALINNWDLKNINNAIYVAGGERHYEASDVGASFGKTGGPAGRSKSDLKGYEGSKFIEKIKPAEVDFVMHSRPFILGAINLPNYANRTSMEKIVKHIPRQDAKWLGQILGRLSDQQVRDCFRAGGYSAEQVEAYAREVQKRIAELNAL
jgi:hypothetical protein